MTGARMWNVTTVSAVVVLMGLSVLSAVAQGQTEQSADRSGMLVTTAWLQAHLSDPGLVVLCVGRSRDQYDAGHIPGARFVEFDELVEQHEKSLNALPPVAALQAVFESLGVGDDSRLVLYGEGGGLLAAKLYFALDYLGHGAQVALLDGGLEKWNAESRPTSREAAHPARATFTPHVQADLLITTAKMQELSRSVANGASSEYVLLDARPPQEYAGVVRSEAIPAAGHIAGARSLYWKQLVQSETVPALRDPAELQRQFANAGAAPGKLVVTYCRTGVQSSFDYFVAKYLGYKAAMYDGSVYEWVHAAGNPLVVSDAPTNAGKSAK